MSTELADVTGCCAALLPGHRASFTFLVCVSADLFFFPLSFLFPSSRHNIDTRYKVVELADGRRGKPRGKPDMFYYDLLGVPREASDRDIRRAFKKLAIKHHPDKHPNDPNAHENFLQYTRAYEIMKDHDLREKYNKLGKDGLEEDEKNGGGGGGGECNLYDRLCILAHAHARVRVHVRVRVRVQPNCTLFSNFLR